MAALLLALRLAVAVPPGARLERLVDASGRPAGAIATVERIAGGAQQSLLLVRGVAGEDLVVWQRRALSSATPTALHAVALGSRDPLRIERLADGRLAARGGRGSLRWLEEDAETRTVRCALAAVVEGADARLVPAAAAWGALKEALGETFWSEAELPLRVVRPLAPGPAPAAAARRRMPMPADDPEAEGLLRDAEAAFAQALRMR